MSYSWALLDVMLTCNHDRVAQIGRNSLLKEKQQVRKYNPKSTPLCFQPPTAHSIGQLWPLLKNIYPSSWVVPECFILGPGVRFVYCRAPTIGSIISQSLYKQADSNHNWLVTKGFYDCGYSRCTAYKFASVSKGNTYPIRSYMNCNTKHVATPNMLYI